MSLHTGLMILRVMNIDTGDGKNGKYIRLRLASLERRMPDSEEYYPSSFADAYINEPSEGKSDFLWKTAQQVQERDVLVIDGSVGCRHSYVEAVETDKGIFPQYAKDIAELSKDQLKEELKDKTLIQVDSNLIQIFAIKGKLTQYEVDQSSSSKSGKPSSGRRGRRWKDEEADAASKDDESEDEAK